MRIHRIMPSKIGIIYNWSSAAFLSVIYVLDYVHTMSVMGKLNIKNYKTICWIIIHVVHAIAIYIIMCIRYIQ